jgi:hypothetical protein
MQIGLFCFSWVLAEKFKCYKTEVLPSLSTKKTSTIHSTNPTDKKKTKQLFQYATLLYRL